MKRRKTESDPTHGRHKTENFPFSMWLPVEQMAKIRHLSRTLGIPATRIFLRAITPLTDTVRLDAEDRAWIDARLRHGAKRAY